jgi:hypothetical protein
MKLVTNNREKAKVKLDRSLVAILDTIYQVDQKYTQQLKGIEEKYEWESAEIKAQRKIISEKDSINLIKIQKVLDERRWLGIDIIGNRGNSTLFLVIQHSDLVIQEKYLPIMRIAVNKGNTKASSLALLDDRVALRKGNRSICGSQVGRNKDTEEYFVLPLKDAIHAAKREAKVKHGKLQDYISNWKMTWIVAE